MSIDDDLNDLTSVLRAATPAPDARRRAENIALARKNFSDLQGSRDDARLTADRPATGWMRGVKDMLKSLNPRAALGATTALVAVGLVAIVPEWQRAPGLTRAPSPAPATIEEIADMPQQELHTPPQVSVSEPMATVLGTTPGNEGARARMSSPVMGLSEAADAPMASISGIDTEARVIIPQSAETYPVFDNNPLKITAQEPVSTFSIDVDTASYAVVRSSLMAGQLPPADAVRIEEMVNYFPYDYAAPEAREAPFRSALTVVGTPWNPDTRLVHIAIQGEKPAVEKRPPLNLVFLIDTSGSMNAPDRLPLLKQSLSLMLSRLSERDQVAIVAYAGSAGQVLAPTPASERAAIMEALTRLEAGGSTAGQAGLQQAYAVAAGMAEEGEVTRVILATDGDFNVGLSDPDALKAFITEKRDSGTYLSVLGFGRGNLNDATMQALAQNGNGQAAYIDTLSEAQKVLVDQFSGAFFPIANDVKIQVEFNPAEVAEYRLIGYETRALNREDFNNDRVDAGEIGAGHSVTALYEITPVDSPARLSDPLRYQPEERGESTDELGYLKLRYKRPGSDTSELIEMPIRTADHTPDTEMQFAIAIAGFGQLLRGGAYLGDWGYDHAIELANEARGPDPFGYRAEAVGLMRLARSLSE